MLKKLNYFIKNLETLSASKLYFFKSSLIVPEEINSSGRA